MADDLAALVAELKRLDAAATRGVTHREASARVLGGCRFKVVSLGRARGYFYHAEDADLYVAARNALPTLLSALETAQRERDEARAVVNAKWPDMAELDEKLADHDAWVRRQRMMRVAIEPVNVEAVGDLLREMRALFAAGIADVVMRDARIMELEREVAALRASAEDVRESCARACEAQAVAVECASDSASALRESAPYRKMAAHIRAALAGVRATEGESDAR